MQCVEEQLGQGGIETVDPEFVPVVFHDEAADSGRLAALPQDRAAPAAVSNLDACMCVAPWEGLSSFEPTVSSVAPANRAETAIVDGSDEEGDEFFEEDDDDDEFEEDDFDDLDDLDDDYEDEEDDAEFDPDLEE